MPDRAKILEEQSNNLSKLIKMDEIADMLTSGDIIDEKDYYVKNPPPTMSYPGYRAVISTFLRLMNTQEIDPKSILNDNNNSLVVTDNYKNLYTKYQKYEEHLKTYMGADKIEEVNTKDPLFCKYTSSGIYIGKAKRKNNSQKLELEAIDPKEYHIDENYNLVTINGKDITRKKLIFIDENTSQEDINSLISNNVAKKKSFSEHLNTYTSVVTGTGSLIGSLFGLPMAIFRGKAEIQQANQQQGGGGTGEGMGN